HRPRAAPRARRRWTEDLAADAASRRRNGDLAHVDIGVELGGAFRQLRCGDWLLLADIAGADRMNHQVAQGHRGAHLGQEPVHGRGGIGWIDLGSARAVRTLVDERRRILRCIVHTRVHGRSPGACAACGPHAAPRRYMPPRAVERSAMFCALRMRLLCEPSTWHSTDGPASVARRSRSMSPRPDLGPKPRLGHVASAIERAAERRADAAALAALESDPHARAYVVAGELVVLKKATALADPLFTLAEARALGGTAELVFLGLCENAPRFAVALESAAAEILKTRDEFVVTDLRSIAVRGMVEADHLPPLAEGKAL